MGPTEESLEWLRDLVSQEEPPSVRLGELKRRGFISGDRQELALLVEAGCDFQQDTRDGSVWINVDDFVRSCARVAIKLGPPPTLH